MPNNTSGKYYPLESFTNNSTVYNYTTGLPSDSRTVISKKDDLQYCKTFCSKIGEDWANYLYMGLIVSVVADTPENNGVYYCKEKPKLNSRTVVSEDTDKYKNADELWEKIGDFPIDLPTSVGDYVLTATGEPGNISYHWTRNPLLPDLPTESGRYSLNIDNYGASWITAGMYFVGKSDNKQLFDGSTDSVSIGDNTYEVGSDEGATVLCPNNCLYTIHDNKWKQITFPCSGNAVLQNNINFAGLFSGGLGYDRFGFLTPNTVHSQYIEDQKFKAGTPLEFIFRTILEGTVTPTTYTLHLNNGGSDIITLTSSSVSGLFQEYLAQPNPTKSGYNFKGYFKESTFDTHIPKDSSYESTFTVLFNSKTEVTLYAKFIQVFTVSVSANKGGTAVIHPDGTTTKQVEKGSSCRIIATPDSDYQFDYWSDGDIHIRESDYRFTVNSDLAFVANFKEDVVPYYWKSEDTSADVLKPLEEWIEFTDTDYNLEGSNLVGQYTYIITPNNVTSVTAKVSNLQFRDQDLGITLSSPKVTNKILTAVGLTDHKVWGAMQETDKEAFKIIEIKININ